MATQTFYEFVNRRFGERMELLIESGMSYIREENLNIAVFTIKLPRQKYALTFAASLVLYCPATVWNDKIEELKRYIG